ncbi:MAG: ABC-2 family transporter protein [Thermoguttaceae bacterium]|nr:ABC-2 family transporter protein [Thermoguttaceae bacterium]
MREIQTYLRVLITFARNSLVRDMTFRANFLIELVASVSWMFMHLAFWLLVFHYTPSIGVGTGWGRYEFFLFIATTLLIQSLTQTFFLSNADTFTELVRSGDLDMLLVKPLDTQFLISFRQVKWASLGNFFLGLLLLWVSFTHIAIHPTIASFVLYPFYILCGVAIFYGMMISLAATSVWMGRNATLLDFWFYLTNFSRYPSEIFSGGAFGKGVRFVLTFLFPVLLVANVPARLIVKPLAPETPLEAAMPLIGLAVAILAVAISRRFFQYALRFYRSASC